MSDDVPAWEDPRRVLSRHGLAPKRGYSQNFLVARSAVERIAELTRSAKELIELGPGLGTLTAELLRTGARVIAVERDPDMRAVLATELGHIERLRVVEGDAATVQLDTIAPDFAADERIIVGNLPYAVTGAILRNLTAQKVARAIVMVQREVRDRLVADPSTKEYGALTVFVGASYEARPAFIVPPGAFHPPPKVTSAVVELVRRATPIAEETPAFRAVVRGAFDARRKTLRNALGIAGYDNTAIDAALDTLGIDGKRRGETLSIAELAQVAQALGAPRGHVPIP